MKVQQLAFYGPLSDVCKKIKEVPVLMCISMIILAILSFGMGVLLIPSLREVVLDPAVNVILNGVEYSKTVLGG
jgi:hypothetical protein